jgi:outer membrane protein
MKIRMRSVLYVVVVFLFANSIVVAAEDGKVAQQETAIQEGDRADIPTLLNLQYCIDTAIKNNRHRMVSQSSIDIAETQYQQALSSYWPQLKFEMTASMMDEDPNFIFPSTQISLGSAATPLAEAIANTQLTKMGITPQSVGQAQYNALLAQATAMAFQGVSSIQIPAQDIKLMDRDNLVSSLNLFYPLYTGGKRSAVVEQAKLGVNFAKEASRKTDLQVIHDVQKMYFGSILAESLHKLGRETLERFEVTLELTEKLYQGGSMRVKKTDYLRTQVVVSSVRSMVELLKSNEELAKSALVNSMGLAWNSRVEIEEKEILFSPYQSDLDKLVKEAHLSNPLLNQMEIGLRVSDAKIKEAKSGHLPLFVLFGNVNRIDNSYDSGIVTDTNKNSWALGIRMELPLFTGFRTQNEIAEARSRLTKMGHEKILLKEGIALQVKDAFLQIARSQGQVRATKDALDSARENRELNIRAYQDELVETKDVIEAQIMEFFINGQYLKALYDNQANKINLEFIIGKNVLHET